MIALLTSRQPIGIRVQILRLYSGMCNRNRRNHSNETRTNACIDCLIFNTGYKHRQMKCRLATVLMCINKYMQQVRPAVDAN